MLKFIRQYRARPVMYSCRPCNANYKTKMKRCPACRGPLWKWRLKTS